MYIFESDAFLLSFRHVPTSFIVFDFLCLSTARFFSNLHRMKDEFPSVNSRFIMELAANKFQLQTGAAISGQISRDGHNKVSSHLFLSSNVFLTLFRISEQSSYDTWNTEIIRTLLFFRIWRRLRGIHWRRMSTTERQNHLLSQRFVNIHMILSMKCRFI